MSSEKIMQIPGNIDSEHACAVFPYFKCPFNMIMILESTAFATSNRNVVAKGGPQIFGPKWAPQFLAQEKDPSNFLNATTPLSNNCAAWCAFVNFCQTAKNEVLFKRKLSEMIQLFFRTNFIDLPERTQGIGICHFFDVNY